jgi:hypothetical protein
LAKSSLVNNLYDFIPVSKLLTNLSHVVAFFVCDRILVLSSDVTNKINSFVYSELNLFQFS